MKVGFTGTRYGLTREQKQAFEGLLTTLVIDEWAHGDCRGSDAETVVTVKSLLGSHVKAICHPGESAKDGDASDRAYTTCNDEVRESKSHFARNRDIVEESDMLIACPGSDREVPFGGTFYTVQHARKKRKPIIIVWPSGVITREEPPKVG